MNVLIAIPTFDTILPETFKAIYNLYIPDNVTCYFDFVRGYDCATARNNIAHKAMIGNFDYLLMIDSDIVVPENTLQVFLEDSVDICLGMYFRKYTTSSELELFKKDQFNFISTCTIHELPTTDCRFSVKGGGYGCVFINTKLFNLVSFPWFKYIVYDSGEILSEDNYFSYKLADCGIPIYCDPRILCKHSQRVLV